MVSIWLVCTFLSAEFLKNTKRKIQGKSSKFWVKMCIFRFGYTSHTSNYGLEQCRLLKNNYVILRASYIKSIDVEKFMGVRVKST